MSEEIIYSKLGFIKMMGEDKITCSENFQSLLRLCIKVKMKAPAGIYYELKEIRNK